MSINDKQQPAAPSSSNLAAQLPVLVSVGALILLIAMYGAIFQEAPREPQQRKTVAATLPTREPTMRRGRDIDDATEIDRFLAPFHSAQGIPLRKLVERYGLQIAYVEVTPIEALKAGRHPEDLDGDWVVSIVIDGVPNKKMPCNLKRWQTLGGITRSVSEVILRDGKFLVKDEGAGGSSDLLYWAHSGKCPKP